ncbi:MAG: hypothetical protein PVJ86_00815 [Phycisphaerales bacterium]|jgi:hypothetical protein
MANWGKHEIEKLKLHYRQFNIPSDQILKDRDILERFTEWFNAKVTPNDEFVPKQVADQLLKLRKGGKLPRLRK